MPGATLHYEIRGHGPLLLLLPGSGGDAVIFDPIADRLATLFTVVALDPRGYSHSVLDHDTSPEQHVEIQSDDAYRLLTHLLPDGESAYVFGGSGGAIVAMDLLARHPRILHRVLAHEPPCFAVLPDAADHHAFVDEVYRRFRIDGMAAASACFVAGIGGTLRPLPDPADLPPRAADMVTRLAANAPLMMEYELRRFTAHRPDIDALAPHADRLTLGAGRETRGHLPYRPAAHLAARLGLEVAEFPGGHSGFTDAPAEFAERLIAELLASPGQL
ncbi:alpha/beta hydrolase [Nocardia sp. NEAU-351]|uniref:Alpha/beta hydrolase n=1 Tax=Nocardia bovistercoris TaxID=2785916 RepID=A0A931N3J0_9NOCA|nr:alpha/beta hydrolase [Nocardia bovistercoris]